VEKVEPGGRDLANLHLCILLLAGYSWVLGIRPKLFWFGFGDFGLVAALKCGRQVLALGNFVAA
jgi:hypothetical protein